ncbi:MAG TPA: glycine zipper domain-containing protein, partial [Thermoanaerobaculia bacterium]|nr:glycine zipper domain-containing protein [Thermoanaerobaculia bacterium]
MVRKFSAVVLIPILVAACASSNPDDPNAKAKRGAGVGAAAGAVVGAIIGNQAGGAGKTGAVVGAIAGAAIGGAVGHRMDQQQKELQQIPGVEVSRPAENEIDVNLTNDILFDFNSA